MKKLSFILFFSLVFSTAAHAQFSELQTIEIGTLSTTHVIFTSDLSYVDISKQDVILAKVVDASKNILAIKAKAAFDYVTTVSALEANGTMHTFKVKYNPFPSELVVDTRLGAKPVGGATVNTQVRPTQDQEGTDAESQHSSQVVVSQPLSGGAVNVTSNETSNFGKADAPTLEEVMKLPQQLYHIGDRNFKIEAYCTNVFVYSDLIYLVITIYNNSDIGYEAGDAQFTIENLRRTRQNLATDKPVWSKSSYGSLSCAPRGQTMVGYTIPKFTLLKNECLKVYIYEKKGTRNLVLTLTDKDINYAVSPK